MRDDVEVVPTKTLPTIPQGNSQARNPGLCCWILLGPTDHCPEEEARFAASRTSCSVIRPPGPVPRRRVTSIPRSAARRRARGLMAGLVPIPVFASLDGAELLPAIS